LSIRTERAVLLSPLARQERREETSHDGDSDHEMPGQMAVVRGEAGRVRRGDNDRADRPCCMLRIVRNVGKSLT
jgi:hypothetical protein